MKYLGLSNMITGGLYVNMQVTVEGPNGETEIAIPVDENGMDERGTEHMSGIFQTTIDNPVAVIIDDERFEVNSNNMYTSDADAGKSLSTDDISYYDAWIPDEGMPALTKGSK